MTFAEQKNAWSTLWRLSQEPIFPKVTGPVRVPAGISLRNWSRSSVVSQLPETRPHFLHSITYGRRRANCFSASLTTAPEQRPQTNSFPFAVSQAVNVIFVIFSQRIQ